MQGDELNLLALLKLGQSADPPGRDSSHKLIFPKE